MVQRLVEIYGWPDILFGIGVIVGAVGLVYSKFRESQHSDSGAKNESTHGFCPWIKAALRTPMAVLAAAWLLTTISWFWKVYADKQSTEESERRREALLTGGESFPVIYPTTPFADKSRFELRVKNQGDSPLYDVVVRVRDVSSGWKIAQEKGLAGYSSEEYQQTITKGRDRFTIGNIAPNATGEGAPPVGVWHASHTNEQVFFFSVDARNGSGSGKLECYREDGVWKYKAVMGFGGHLWRTNYHESAVVIPTGPKQ